ncbi:MAG: formylmethanofuran dehydrogenase subunit B [Planctomycetota bacterium]
MSLPISEEHSSIACTQCGCVCDDLKITVADNRIVGFSPACALAEPWFRWLSQPLPVEVATVSGRVASLDQAVQRAAELLLKARSPLFFGLSRSSTDGQRAACELADRVGAVIDTTASIGHGPSIMAFQAAGESTCTLGEVRHRSDLVVYWGSDPVMTHPRHLERIVDRPGLYRPGGRRDRRLIVIDSCRTASAAVADQFIQTTPGGDFEIFWVLRALLKSIDVPDGSYGGVPLEVLKQLAQDFAASHYGAIFFGVRLAEGPSGHCTIEALLRLVTDLNLHTRFVARRMRVPGDVTGADSVLCWQTGYPFSVSLSSGYPRYNPGEYSAGPMLARGEADCLVLVGGERVEKLPREAQEHIRRIPVIQLDPPETCREIPATVRFNTAIYGIHRRGTAYRMDEVPVPLRKVLDSPLPSDDDVLRAILRVVKGS